MVVIETIRNRATRPEHRVGASRRAVRATVTGGWVQGAGNPPGYAARVGGEGTPTAAANAVY